MMNTIQKKTTTTNSTSYVKVNGRSYPFNTLGIIEEERDLKIGVFHSTTNKVIIEPVSYTNYKVDDIASDATYDEVVVGIADIFFV